jgi:ribosomal protein L11 methyltransferase
VVAVDVDPLAVDAARANAAANGVADRVRCRAGEPDAPVSDADGAFDLVLANIQAHVLRALRDRVAARVAAGGALILSGLLTNQADDLARRYADAGLAIDHVRASDIDPAWSRAALRR